MEQKTDISYEAPLSEVISLDNEECFLVSGDPGKGENEDIGYDDND